MTTVSEAITAAEAARTAAIDLAQQAFRAAIEQPAAAYLAATSAARAELETAEALAQSAYTEAVNAALTPAADVGPAGRPIPPCGVTYLDFGACVELHGHYGPHRDAAGLLFRLAGE